MWNVKQQSNEANLECNLFWVKIKNYKYSDGITIRLCSGGP